MGIKNTRVHTRAYPRARNRDRPLCSYLEQEQAKRF
jgi:hypothetical protein